MKIKDLKKGDYFKLNETSKTVYVRGEYCREEKKYICSRFDDFCSSRLFVGSREVCTDFTF